MASRAAPPVSLPLDQNFPQPILAALDAFIVDVRLIPLRSIDQRLPTLDDRSLVLALHQLGYAGLVTNNYKMLGNPRELAAVLKTNLTVFAIEGVGHDPLRATGALLRDLPGMVKRMRPSIPQVFWLRPRNPSPVDPWDLLRKTAEHRDEDQGELYDEVRVSDEELSRPVLGPGDEDPPS